MATLRLDEVAVQAIVAKLKAGWATRISEINAEKADDIVCLAPDAGGYFVGRMQQIPVWPACFVMAGPSQFKE